MDTQELCWSWIVREPPVRSLWRLNVYSASHLTNGAPIQHRKALLSYLQLKPFYARWFHGRTGAVLELDCS